MSSHPMLPLSLPTSPCHQLPLSSSLTHHFLSLSCRPLLRTLSRLLLLPLVMFLLLIPIQWVYVQNFSPLLFLSFSCQFLGEACLPFSCPVSSPEITHTIPVAAPAQSAPIAALHQSAPVTAQRQSPPVAVPRLSLAVEDATYAPEVVEDTAYAPKAIEDAAYTPRGHKRGLSIF